MAKTTAPLLSMGARGQIGKSQVYASWRGISYARQLVVPSNPNSTAQQATRGVFAAMSDLWKNGPTLLLAPWNAFASGKPLTGRNAFIGENISALRGEADRALFKASPGARGGPAAVSVTAADGGTGDVDIAIVAPPTPDGWTLSSAVAVVILDGDPAAVVPFPIAAAENTSPVDGGETDIAIDGIFEVGDDLVVAGFLEWTKPNGQTAYGASQTDTITLA